MKIHKIQYDPLVKNPLGPLTLAATSSGLCLVEYDNPKRINDYFTKTKRLHPDLDIIAEASPLLKETAKKLDAYFKGSLQKFDIPLSPFGTDFQNQVWQKLTEIPHGETWSYKDQADSLGSPQAVRAVATANSKNPISIIIPCHRVIGSNGNLTGYAGGLDRKKWLLDFEKSSC